MTLEELRKKCIEQVELQGEDAEVGLIIPRPWKTQKRICLVNVSGAPYGEPVADVPGGTMCFFRAHEVLQWLGRCAQAQEN